MNAKKLSMKKYSWLFLYIDNFLSFFHLQKIVDEIRSDQNLEKQVDRSIFEKKIADLESQAINSFRKLSQKTAESLESGSETGEAGWGYDWMHQPKQNVFQNDSPNVENFWIYQK